METEHRLNEEELEMRTSNIRKMIIIYTDMMIRGLLSFFVIGIGFYLILVVFFKMKFIYVLPLVFIATILISPFLSKIRIAEKMLDKYDEWLKLVFNLR